MRTRQYAAYDQQFVPSWKTLETFLRDTYRKQARPQTALTSLRDGRAALRRTDSRLHDDTDDGGAVHQLGLEEVARIEKEMEQLARSRWLRGSRH